MALASAPKRALSVMPFLSPTFSMIQPMISFAVTPSVRLEIFDDANAMATRFGTDIVNTRDASGLAKASSLSSSSSSSSSSSEGALSSFFFFFVAVCDLCGNQPVSHVIGRTPMPSSWRRVDGAQGVCSRRWRRPRRIDGVVSTENWVFGFCTACDDARFP